MQALMTIAPITASEFYYKMKNPLIIKVKNLFQKEVNLEVKIMTE